MINCPKCRAVASSSERFCKMCGTSLVPQAGQSLPTTNPPPMAPPPFPTYRMPQPFAVVNKGPSLAINGCLFSMLSAIAIAYDFFGLSFFFGLLAIAGVITSFISLGEMQGTRYNEKVLAITGVCFGLWSAFFSFVIFFFQFFYRGS